MPPHPEVELLPLNHVWLSEVVRVEAAAHPHPWLESHFVDVLHAGHAAQMLVADGHLLGYFVAMLGADEVHLLNITVTPQFQRQGWARVLLDALALWARGQGAHLLWLEVRVGNVRAQGIYQTHGYRCVGQRKNYYPTSSEQREDALVMSLKI